jgi:predicted dehydrogenase
MSGFNWGIMAAGGIAGKFAAALNFEPDARPYAVASRSIEKARDFAARHGFEKAYGSYEELAADPNADVVYIATPMSLHYENVKLCFEYGKHVLCEKTVTLNSGQLEELIHAARSKRLFFMEAMWMKCMPHFKKASAWFGEGKIGGIKAINVTFSNTPRKDPESRLFRNDLGGGALLDITVYPLTLITHFLGYEPSEVLSAVHLSGEGDRSLVDMNEAVILKYEDAFASLFAGFESENENKAVIIGSEGRIEFNPWFFMTDTVKLYGKDGSLVSEFTRPHQCNGYEYEIAEVQDCLRRGLSESRAVPLSSTLGVLRIMDKLRADWGLKFIGEY